VRYILTALVLAGVAGGGCYEKKEPTYTDVFCYPEKYPDYVLVNGEPVYIEGSRDADEPLMIFEGNVTFDGVREKVHPTPAEMEEGE